VPDLTAVDLVALIAAFGYVAVFLAVAIESTGIPCPGETTLVLAGAYAAATHQLSLPLVVLAAACGAIVGDNLGYWLGRLGGFRLLARYGKYIGLDAQRMSIGQYFFWKHGPKVVVLGRFVAVLRAWAAFLAGVNRMPWRTFTIFNVAGGLAWATVFGVGGYAVGANIQELNLPWYGGVALLGAGLLAFVFVAHKGEHRLILQAQAAGFTPMPADTPAAHRGRVVAWPVLLTVAGGLAIGLLEVWFLTATTVSAEIQQDLTEWSWALSAATAGRSIALGAVIVVSAVAGGLFVLCHRVSIRPFGFRAW
jgi:membrane protein DedA with SNARE-associated domain